jgi:FkbM family methyltransferase
LIRPAGEIESSFFEHNVYLSERQGIHVRDGETIIDVGANIGIFALQLSGIIDELGLNNVSIIACEPLPHNFEMLCKNVARHFPGTLANRITLLQTGLVGQMATNGDTEEEENEREFVFFPRMCGNSCLATHLGDKETTQLGAMAERSAAFSNAARVRCPVTTLALLIQQNVPQGGRVGLLKIDCE